MLLLRLVRFALRLQLAVEVVQLVLEIVELASLLLQLRLVLTRALGLCTELLLEGC